MCFQIIFLATVTSTPPDCLPIQVVVCFLAHRRSATRTHGGWWSARGAVVRPQSAAEHPRRRVRAAHGVARARALRARSTVRSARAEQPRELAQSGFRVGPTRPRLGVFALDERDRPNAPRRIRLVTPGWGRRTRAAPARRAIRRRGARARIVRLDSSFLGHCRARERFVPGCAGRGKKNVSACPRKRRHQGAQSHDAASHSVSHSRKITTRTLAR